MLFNYLIYRIEYVNESWSKNEKHFNVFWGQKHFSSFQITGDEFLNLPCTEVCLVYLNTVCIWGSNTSLTASHGWLLQDQGRFQGIDWDGCLFLLQKSYLYLVILWTACKSFWIFFFSAVHPFGLFLWLNADRVELKPMIPCLQDQP